MALHCRAQPSGCAEKGQPPGKTVHRKRCTLQNLLYMLTLRFLLRKEQALSLQALGYTDSLYIYSLFFVRAV